jgi:glyoxylate reductase
LLTDRVDADLLEAAGRQLRIVANYAVGFDNIDIAACSARSVLVANTPDVLTESRADMAFALMMAAARRVVEGDALLRSGAPWLWGPEMMLGQDLYGRTLGIIGLGRIGSAVAARASGFSMQVVHHNPVRSLPASLVVGSSRGDDSGPSRSESVDLEHLLAVSDFVSIHVRLSDETHHLLNAERLSMMKPTAVLVNTSRGPVVDEEALADALESGRLFAAALDVFEREPAVSPRLLVQPRAVLSPHLGSATIDTRVAMGMLAANNVLAALSGRRPPSLLNSEAWKRSQPSEP